MEASTMWTEGHGPESFPIVYCIPYRGNFPTPNYGLQITDTKVMLQWTKSIKKFPGLDLCTQGVLVYAKLSNSWHAAT